MRLGIAAGPLGRRISLGLALFFLTGCSLLTSFDGLSDERRGQHNGGTSDPIASGADPTNANATDGGSTDANGTDANGTDANGTDANGTDANGTDAGTDAGGTPGGIVWRDTKSAVVPNPGGFNVTVTKPTGTTAGDALLAAVAFGDSANVSLPTFTAPAGWSLVRRLDHGTVTSLGVYVKVATAGEPASYTWTFGLQLAGLAWVSAYSGVNTTTPIDAEAGVDLPMGTSFATPSITTTVAGTVLVATFVARGTAVTWSAPSGTSTRANRNNGDSRSGLGVDVPRPTAGASGVFTAISPVSQDYGLAHLLALRP